VECPAAGEVDATPADAVSAARDADRAAGEVPVEDDSVRLHA